MKKRTVLMTAFVMFTLLLQFVVNGYVISGASGNSVTEDGIIYLISEDGEYASVFGYTEDIGSSVNVLSEVSFGGKDYPVTRIVSGAFSECPATSFVLSQSLESIGDKAFSNCYGLSEVDFLYATVSLGSGVFEKCSKLSSFKNYSNVYYVGNGTFEDTAWYAAKSQTSDILFGYALYEINASRSSYILSSSVKTVSPYAAKGNTAITNITVYPQIEKIGKGAFEDCSNLTSLSVRSGSMLKEIGDDAFRGCIKLGSVPSVINKLENIGSGAFYGCSSMTSALLSSSKLISIGNGAFSHCSALYNVSFPDTLKTVGNYAFSGCAKLAKFTAGNIEYVGYDAFRGCSLISDKTPFENVTYIGTGAFDGTEIYSAAQGKPCYIGHVLYKTEEKIPETKAVPEGTEIIAPCAFYNISGDITVALPTSLTNLYENAFVGMTDDTRVFVFSDKETAYAGFCGSKHGNVYYSCENAPAVGTGVKLYKINGITVDKLPDVSTYKKDSVPSFDGIKISLDTENGKFDISEIGYKPEYKYDLASSGIVEVSYCGYKTTFALKITDLTGDVNGDGVINADDVPALRSYISEKSGDDEINLIAADMNGDSKVDTRDLVLLKKALADKE